jgi:ribonuclease J
MLDKAEQFSFQALGGLGEVGMNSMLYRFGELLLPVDCGVLFADTNNFGIDAIFPDFRELLSQKDLKWIITHAHEDHIGAIAYVLLLCQKLNLKAPTFYAPPFAAALIRSKLSDDSRFASLKSNLNQILPVELNQEISIGSVRVKFVEVRHSTPDSCALALTWTATDKPLKIFHSADFKIDLNEFEDGVKSLEIFNCFNNERPDFLFMDSTNADREGQSVSEKEILPHLEKLFSAENNRIFVTLFSSNVYRVASLIHLAEKLGRKVALSGRSLQTATRLALELKLFDKMPSFKDSTLVSVDSITGLAKNKQFIICTGSQGELRSALSKIADDAHPDLHIHEDDLGTFNFILYGL